MKSFRYYFVASLFAALSFAAFAQDGSTPRSPQGVSTAVINGNSTSSDQPADTPQEGTTDAAGLDDSTEADGESATASPESSLQAETSGMQQSGVLSGLSGSSVQLLSPQGSADVSYAGSFVYSYPIEVPPGTNGVAPALALTYNSANQNGMLGVGFALSGLPTIERDPSYGITFTNTDHYTYQGLKLFPAADGRFHTEKETFERITAYKGSPLAPTIDANDAAYWLIERKDGSKMYFGSGTGRISAVGMNGLPRLWALDEYEDVNGNFYTVSYEADTANGDFYPTKIIYTQGNGLAPYKAVIFQYDESRTDHGPAYIPSLVDTNKRLHWINVRSNTDSQGNNGSLVRKYRIDYGNGSSTQRSRVTTIQQYGSDESSVLPATTFTWTEGSWGYTPYSFGGYAGAYAIYKGDFDGNGKVDLFMHSNSTSPYDVVHLSRGDGGYDTVTVYSSPILSGYIFYPGDYNGDGKTDLFAHNDNTNANITLLSNGNGYFTDTNHSFNAYHGYTIQTGDFNGDGKTDLFMHSNTTSPYDVVHLSRGDGGYDTVVVYSSPILSGYIFYPGDYNRDGKTDLFAHNDNTNANITLLSNGNGYFTDTNHSFIGYHGYTIQTGDFNADGKTDLFMHSNTINDVVHISKGDGNYQTVVSYSSPILSGYTFYPGDYNGDGKTDLFAHNGSTNANITLLSNGNGYFTDTNQPFNAYNGYTILADDLNGDGQTDLFLHDASGSNVTRICSGPQPDLLSTVVTSGGGTCSTLYSPAPQVTGAIVPSSSAYPSIANSSPRPLVTQVTFNGGQGETTAIDYSYSNGKFYSSVGPDRADLGFQLVTKSNVAAGTRTVTSFNQNKPFQGLTNMEYTCAWNGVAEGLKYSGKTNAYSTSNPVDPHVNYIKLDYTIIQLYDGQSTSLDHKTDYAYGEFGDITSATRYGFTGLSNGRDREVTTIDYASGTSPYYVVKAKSRTVSSYDSIGVFASASQTQFYYDGNILGVIGKGRLTKTEAYDGATWQSSQSAYDAHGNIQSSWDANNNLTVTNYDGTYHDLIYQTTNAKNQTITVHYDVYRRPDQITDANGQATLLGYDVFGRRISSTAPTDTGGYPTTTTEYSDVTSPSLLPRFIHTKQLVSGSSYLERYDYYDGIGRLIQSKRQGIAPNWIAVDYYYDGAGRNYRTSVPYFTTSSSWGTGRDTAQKATVLAYDPAGRTVMTTNPDGTSQQARYQQNVTTFVDENAHVSQRVVDLADSRLLYQKRYTGTDPSVTLYSTSTTRNYRGLQQVSDNAGNTIAVTINMLGRKTQYVDPDKGTWAYQYDPNGNMTSQTDGKGVTVGFTYDVLNRITRISYPTNTATTYTYDEAGHGAGTVGKVTSMTYNRGSESFSYDAKGRLTFLTRSLDGVARTMEYHYDSADRVTWMRYPHNEVVTNGYGTDGYLHSVAGSATYVSAVGYNAWGKVTSITYGNSVLTTYDYYDASGEIDPNNGNRAFSYRLRGMWASSNGAIVNLGYQYDPVGNMRLKIDGNDSSRSETYAYDELDRLSSASAGVYGSLTFSYNQIDNIISKDGRSYSYGAQHPHAVSSAGGAAYGYDANGNMTSWNGQTIGYDEAGRMVSGPGGATYCYDGGTQRTIKTLGTKTTYYFFPEFQEEYTSGVLTKTLIYYEANGQRVAQWASFDGYALIHSDHLGSSVRLTDLSGTLILLQTGYKPYGTDAYSSGSGTTKYRFTAQEKEESGLYYYNARYYDPDLGRFIQADSVLDGLNRYAYCHNNPVRFTDPTGRDVGNPGNGGWNSEGNPVTVTVGVKQTAGYTASESPVVTKEKESNRGQTAQRTEAIASGGLRGDHPVNQKDLEPLGIPHWEEACRFLSLLTPLQQERGEYFTPDAVRKLIESYQDPKKDWLGHEMYVKEGPLIENDAARMLGFQGGDAQPLPGEPSGNDNATIRVGEGLSGVSHSNVGDPTGEFVHEVWDGGTDHISNPTLYWGLTWW